MARLITITRAGANGRRCTICMETDIPFKSHRLELFGLCAPRTRRTGHSDTPGCCMMHASPLDGTGDEKQGNEPELRPRIPL